VHGGQQAVSGASIALYAAGSGGNGAGATNLLLLHPVTTDQYGGFSLAGDYTCPTATTQVYLVARGGNPGLAAGTSNPALVLATALGDCSNLTPATFIAVDEVTTAAAAWTLAQFLAPGALVGSSATNTTGLRNAFLNAANLVNPSSGTAPGALPAGAGFELAKLNTLANALAPCVNSDGTTGCAALFSASATSTDTLDAALAIVRNPARNVAAVFGLGSPQGPFQPVLAAAPNDWTLSITYGQCAAGTNCGGLSDPSALALDSTGAVWVANYDSPVVSKFASNGTPATPAGYPGQGLRQSYGLTVDPQDSPWVSNQQSVSAAGNNQFGSVSHFTSSGTEVTGAGITAGGIFYPQAVAADPTGNIWVANYGNSSATLLAGSGSALSPNGYAVSALPFTTAVAIDSAHNAWFAAQRTVARVTPAGTVTSYPCCGNPTGIAIDSTGNLWLSDYSGGAVYQVSPAGTALTQVTLAAGKLAPQFLAIDGAGAVWTSNYFGNSVSQLAAGTSALLSPQLGYGRDAPLDEPYGIAVDASGNLWLSNSNGNTLTEFFGLAAPIRTPLLGPPTQP
jgi:streptogramin lyase